MPRRLLIVMCGAVLAAPAVTVLTLTARTESQAMAPVADKAAGQCFADGFDPAPQDAEAAHAAMRGLVTLPPHRAVELPADLTWREDPLEDHNWQFNLHTLRWADVLRREGVRTADAAMTARHQQLLRDWLGDNPPPANPPQAPGTAGTVSRYAWSDMATGLRAIAFSCAIGSYGAQPWLLDALRLHGGVLSSPEFGRQTGNHALHVRSGLLAAGCPLGEEHWTATAQAGIGELLTRSVDGEGVNDEGALMYHALNYRWYREAQRRITACGREPGPVFDRVALMPGFAAHLTAPDGTHEQIGDSDLEPALTSAGTPAEYAASQGRSGTPPAELYRAYARGYVAGRSGWGTQRPFADETFYTVRFGPPLREQAHAHEDAGALTLWAHGGRLLADSGRYDYNRSAMRRHLASRAAHNVVDVRGAAYRRDVPATLLASASSATHDVTAVRVTALDGTVWVRTVLYSRAGGYLVVDDRVRNSARRAMVQRWNLPGGARTSLRSGALTTSGPGANVSMFWLGSRPSVSVVSGRRRPLLGWRSPVYGSVHPSPVAEAGLAGKNGRYTTVVVPRRPGVRPADVQVTGVHVEDREVWGTVTVEGRSEEFRLTETAGSVAPRTLGPPP